MKFNIMLVDPADYPYGHFLDDLVKLLWYGLESLGYDVTIRKNKAEIGCINVVVGGHLLRSMEQVRALAEAGPYIAIQGEVITPKGLNYSNQTALFNEVYLPYLRHATAVWDGTPQNILPLQDLGVTAHLLLGGYHPMMREVVHKDEKDIDFFYYGSLTDHREKMLGQLEARGYRVMFAFDERAIYRNNLIARTKVNLCPNQGTTMTQLPWTRICFLLNNQSLVVVEECRDQEWLSDCFPWASTSQWVDLCEQLLHHPRRQEVVDSYCDRFRKISFVEKLEATVESSLARAAT